MTKFCVRIKIQDNNNKIQTLMGKLIDEDEQFITIKTGQGNIITANKKFLVSVEQTKIKFINQTKKEEDEC